jgi:flagellar hook protein FlgE
MGLASALNTALTGLSAAETTIDVVGNNVANANTVGFKASEVAFATQFLQTQSLGAGPTAVNGGVNPRQIGLGVTTAEITPNFTQGTIQISSNPSDLAIQGDGFFVVQGSQGEQLYTRNGGFKTNAQNELVTISGERLLGQGVNDNFEIQTTELRPLTIPLGTAAVAQATQNVFFEGTLTPTGDLATQARILQTGPLGDAAIPRPASSGNAPVAVAAPGSAPTTAVNGAGSLSAGTYRYYVTFVDAVGNESEPSPVSAGIATAAGNAVDVTIPVAPAGAPTNWVARRIYRTDNSGLGNAFRVGTVADLNVTNTFNDTTADAVLGNATHPQMNADTPNGTYEYFITFAHNLGTTAPSRPAIPGLGPITVANDRILLSGLPNAGSLPPEYNRVNIYRNVASQPGSFFLVAQINPAAQTTFIDSMTDAQLQTQPAIDLDGPKIQVSNTNLVDVLRRDGTNYEQVFQVGTLTFTPQKGGRTLAPKTFEITATTKVVDLLTFMNQALGVQVGTDPLNPIPASNSAAGSVSPGGSVTLDGRIQFVGNNGRDNAIDIGLSSMQMTVAGNQTNINLPFGATQEAIGESASSDFIVYDSLGIPLNVRVTVVQESRDSTSTTYRWFADSGDNDPATGATIAVGTGLIRFDGTGNVLQVTNSTVSIDRRSVSSVSPLEFNLDFNSLSGLATARASLSASRQDGSAAGTLTSFIIGGDGKIRGVFSNGVSRDLGQIRLARFANPAGLEQRGQNMFAAGVNSGLPIQANPGEQGTGSIIAGANELSNTDIGANLIDLITASTQYRGNTRVITAAQQLLDELLNLRR